MRQYHDLLRLILNTGVYQENRTGIGAYTIPGHMLKFDMADGFPALTTKKLAFRAVVGELIGFLRGYENARMFRNLNCNVWNQNANENKAWLANPNRRGEDDLGRVYGVQWRNWRAIDKAGIVHTIDQLSHAIETVRNDPTSRRIIVTAWNPGELDRMALPPCHMMFQLLPHVESNTLHMVMYQRSVDSFLGLPFNIASYALLLHIISRWCGYKTGTLSMMLADVHIYKNHIEQVKEQLSREERKLPALVIKNMDYVTSIAAHQLPNVLEPEDIELVDYDPHPAIKAEMAV